MRHRTVLVVTGLVLLIGGAAIVAVHQGLATDPRSNPDGVTAPAAVATQPMARRASDTRAAPAPAPTATASAPPGAPVAAEVSGALLTAFGHATDLHAFALDALARPAEGGGFYARTAASRCLTSSTTDQSLQASLQRERTLTTAQLQAAERLKALCQDFPQDAIKQTLLAAREHAASGADPLLAAERLLLQADRGDPGARRAAVARSLALGDPLFLSETGALMRLARGTGPEGADGIWFDGRRWTEEDPKEELLAIGMALGVGMCREGAPCAVDAVLAQQCVSHGLCDMDWWAFLDKSARLEGMPDTLAPRARVLAERVRRAVNEQDAGFFVP